MEKNLSNYAIKDIEELETKRIELERYNKEVQLLKSKLEQHFEFEIPTYIILDIVEHEDYEHFCLMINLAVVNNRLSEEQGQILANEVKQMYNIQSVYDKF